MNAPVDLGNSVYFIGGLFLITSLLAVWAAIWPLPWLNSASQYKLAKSRRWSLVGLPLVPYCMMLAVVHKNGTSAFEAAVDNTFSGWFASDLLFGLGAKTVKFGIWLSICLCSVLYLHILRYESHVKRLHGISFGIKLPSS